MLTPKKADLSIIEMFVTNGPPGAESMRDNGVSNEVDFFKKKLAKVLGRGRVSKLEAEEAITEVRDSTPGKTNADAMLAALKKI